ncbi:transcription factor e(y)2-domain-containing protein [Circinella umbellata]|nr:transcription factor e(y)2-domain-containing protein [Circinella umbellata]
MSSDSDKLRLALSRHFVDSGEKERLMNLLRNRLAESGWNDALYAQCRETVRQRKLENVTLDELVKETSDYGRSSVNENIKKELLVQIKKYLDTAFDS